MDVPMPLDAETKAIERPADHKAELRLWLRLLTCTNMVESLIRTRLRERFHATLPRFDLLAQLGRRRPAAGIEIHMRVVVGDDRNLDRLSHRRLPQPSSTSRCATSRLATLP